jgi:pimeloyl-ACP methyl ester carboxylesterase
MLLIRFLFLSLVVLAGALALYSVYGVWRVERDFPPAGQFVEADGLRLHYVDEGGGAPLVLLHGASTSLLDFAAGLAPPLADRHRVLAFDRPGHGYSERPPGEWPNPAVQARYLHSALAALGVRKPLLVGHSWSGSLVLAYLLRYPDETAGGVLLAGVSHPWKRAVAWTNAIAGVPVLGRVFAHTLVFPAGQLLIEGGVAEVFHPELPPPGYLQRTGVELVLRPDDYYFNAQDVRLLSEYLEAQSQEYHRLRQPLLVIHGTRDDIVPAWNHTDRLLKVVPEIEVIRLAGAGHGLHHTRTERIAELISDFSRRVQPAEPGTH